MPSNLSADLRDGYRDLARGLAESERIGPVRARVLFNGGPEGRVQALAAVVLAYREGPKKLWGPVLLDLLAPSILAYLRRLKPRPPVMDAEDVRQQLLFEVLRAAATMPLPDSPHYLRSRLMSRANQGARRWLVREGRRQAGQRCLDAAEEVRK